MRELKQDWRDLFNGFSVALDPRKMFLAFIWLVFTLAGAEFLIYAYSRCFLNLDGLPPGAGLPAMMLFFIRQLFSVGDAVHIWQIKDLATFLQDTLWEQGYIRSIIAFFLIIALWAFFLWARIGGAIYRIAGVEIATEDRPSIRESLEFSKKRFRNFFWGPMILVLGILSFIFFNMLGGEIAWLVQTKIAQPWGLGQIGPALISIFLWIGLIFGIFVIFLAIGLLFAHDLIFAAVAVDGADHFDAVSRSLIYLYHRPWHYIIYHLISVLYGILVISFVWAFGVASWKVTLYSIEISLGQQGANVLTAILNDFFKGYLRPESITFAAVIFTAFTFIYFGVLAGYAISYYVSCKTCIYLLLRKNVDGSDMSEIYYEDDEEGGFLTGPKPTVKSTDSNEVKRPENENGSQPAANPPPAVPQNPKQE